MKSFIVIIVIALISALTGNSFAQSATGQNSHGLKNNSTKEEDIHRLLELIGTNKLGEQVWKQMFPFLRQSAPKVPEQEWQEIDKEFSKEFTSGAYIQMIVSIYSKHFTQEEIKQLIIFYESPIGKKVASTLPQIAQEAMIAGQQRGEEIMRRVFDRLRKKGYSVPTA